MTEGELPRMPVAAVCILHRRLIVRCLEVLKEQSRCELAKPITGYQYILTPAQAARFAGKDFVEGLDYIISEPL